ncbi:hypothetical protein EAG_06712 [Camponotus floridanus]|uniref:Uncharacterized protein n=1 Tax=Camponotus floridanus TaxID=104421 RepID=E2ATK9_CAMFO|nr:hypothetical protein EAG_06712 [Camponotus floridanus]
MEEISLAGLGWERRAVDVQGGVDWGEDVPTGTLRESQKEGSSHQGREDYLAKSSGSSRNSEDSEEVEGDKGSEGNYNVTVCVVNGREVTNTIRSIVMGEFRRGLRLFPLRVLVLAIPPPQCSPAFTVRH